MSGKPPGAPATCLPFCLPRARSFQRTRGYCDRIVVNSTPVDLLLGYLRSKKDAPKISVIPSVFVFCSQQHTRRRKTLFAAVPINPSHPNALDLVILFLLPRTQSRTCSRVASSLLVSDATAGARHHRRRPFSHRQSSTLFLHMRRHTSRVRTILQDREGQLWV